MTEQASGKPRVGTPAPPLGRPVGETPEPRAVATENPLAEGLNVTVSIPPIDVTMIDATKVKDYEIWMFLATFLSNAMVVFAVIQVQGPSNPTAIFAAVLFGVLFAFSFAIVLKRRSAIHEASRQLRFRPDRWNPPSETNRPDEKQAREHRPGSP